LNNFHHTVLHGDLEIAKLSFVVHLDFANDVENPDRKFVDCELKRAAVEARDNFRLLGKRWWSGCGQDEDDQERSHTEDTVRKRQACSGDDRHGTPSVGRPNVSSSPA
jgi:hypothetical protein